MSNILFSVAMSCYNAQRYLKSAISSIISQTYKNWELIVMDDASTDETYNILKVFADQDSRIKLYRQKQNKGLTYNLNILVEYAKGEYIVRHDADDVSLPERLESLYFHINNDKSSSLIYSDYYVIDDEGNVLCLAQPVRNSNLLIKAIMNGYNPIAHGSIAFKKQDFLKIGKYKEQAVKGQDYDLYLRLVFNKMNFGCLTKSLYNQRVHKGSIGQGYYDKGTMNYRAHDRDIYARASLMAYHDNYREEYDYYIDSVRKNIKNLKNCYPESYSECLYAVIGCKRKYFIKKFLVLIKKNPFFLKAYLLLFLIFAPFKIGKLILSKRIPYTTFNVVKDVS